MSKLFVSHSSRDDDFVRNLQQALGDLDQDVWIDSRELRGGDPLWTEIQQAIESASAYAIVVSTDSRDKARVLGVFHGGVHLSVLLLMMPWEEADVASLAVELIETGLATPNPYGHLSLDPALCPYLRGQLGTAECESLTAPWVEAMRQYAEFLLDQQHQKAEIAATLTLLELPNLFALLDHMQRAGDAEATIDLATSLYSLLQWLGKPRLLERVARARDAAAAALGQTWNHARFQAQRTMIEQQLGDGRLRDALDGAQELLRRARAAGETSYQGADFDLAGACFLLASTLQTAGGSEQALPLLDEAQKRFEAVEQDRPGRAAGRGSLGCFAERGNCLTDLGRLDEAASAYEEVIRRGEQLGAERGVAVGKAQLGAVRLLQRRYKEALEAYEEARERFTRLDEPGTVAVIWHQVGRAYQQEGQPEAAEDAYRKSLAIEVQLGDVAGQASTLGQLGTLYVGVLGRPDEAVAFYGKRRTSTSSWAMRRAKAARGTISEIPCECFAVLRKRGRKFVGGSNVSRSSAIGPSCGQLGTSSPKSRQKLETPPPSPRRSARPSPATSPTDATAARTTTPLVASASL